MRYYGICLMAAAMVVSLAGCSDESPRVYSTTGVSAGERSFTLVMPAFSRQSRGVDENAVNTLYVDFADDGGNTVSRQNFTADDLIPSATGYTVTLGVPANAASVRVVANAPASAFAAEPWTLADDPSARPDIVFSGTAELASLEDANPSVTLTRCCAKTDISVTADDFELLGANFYGTPSATLVMRGDDSAAPSLPAGVAYSAEPVAIEPGTTHYHYEAAAGECFLVVRGRYRGTEGYYKVAYIPTDASAEVAVLRNHHYTFTITDAAEYGWPTEDEAAAAEPDNRVTVELRDDNEDIYDLIACRDYYLGVTKSLTVPYDAATIDMEIISSYGGSPLYSVELPGGADAWITAVAEKSRRVVEDAATRTAAVAVTLSLTLVSNDLSNLDRECDVVVRSGDLERRVRITQEGIDFRHDPSRQVLIYNLDGNSAGQPYFDFIEGSLRGATEAESRVARDEALHFSVYGNTYYYTIPRKDGDAVSVTEGAGLFSVTADGDRWEVRCTGGDIDYSMWEGGFRISNSVDNQLIDYPVCHVGLFHNLTGAYLQMNPEGDTPGGWYYYEQVRVTGADGAEYYMLDRNLGASMNLPYSTSGTTTGANTGARGGYFRIANNKADRNINTLLPPPGYEIPSAYDMGNLRIAYTRYGNENVMGMEVSEGAFDQVFIPVCGTLTGAEHTDETHACLWTSTLLSGSQGFDTSSPEYGYWYKYLDLYGAKAEVKNMRIGTIDAAGQVDLYRSMPVRCLHATSEAPLGWELPAVAEGRRRVFVRNVKNWPRMNLWFWSDTNANFGQTWPGVAMTQTEKAGYYYLDIPLSAQYMIISCDNYGQTSNVDIVVEEGHVYEN